VPVTEEFDKYLNCRFKCQRCWYEKHARRNRFGYYGTGFSKLVLSGALPVVAALFSGRPDFTALVVTLSFLLLLAEGSAVLFRFNENWINYRITYEKLSREKAYYDTGSGIYGDPPDGQTPETTFVIRIERLLREENESWSQYAEDAAEPLEEYSP
jgi:hypothetical protein